MYHDEIEANDVTSRYVAGRLNDAEEREFEAHLIDCQRCLDAVESETSLREGVRIVGAESLAARPRPLPDARPAPAGARAYRLLQLAAGLLLAVSAGLGLWVSRSTTALDAVRAERDGLQRRTRQAEQQARGLEQRLAEVPRPATAPAPAPPAAKVLPAAVFALTTVRGSSGDAGPVNRIEIDRQAQLVVLSVEVPTGTGTGDYAVALNDQAGRPIWSGGPFTPPSGLLSVAVDPALLKAGDFVLVVSDKDADGVLRNVGRYPFRVRRP